MAFRNPMELVDYASTLDCIHCGLCLTTCPTYQLTGAEPSSPRGRIHLMRAVAEGHLAPDRAYAEELEFCLLCRHCESVCPAGVRFSEMMEHARGVREQVSPRGAAARLQRWLGFRVLLPSRRLLHLAAGLVRLAQRTGLWRLAARFAGERRAAMLAFPTVPPAAERRPLAAAYPARGERRGTALVLEGCVMPELYGRVNRATATSLADLGWEVRVPAGQGCCGSLHAHNGDLEGARTLARRLVEAFEAGGEASAAVAVNSAGCGSHLRGLGHLFEDGDAFRPRAAAFAARVRDYSELAAAALPARGFAPLVPGTVEGPLAWDDPCHLCHGQQIRRPPRELLDRLCAAWGLARVELPDAESCCGSAGIWSLLRPAESRALLEAKIETLRRSGARTLVTANPGCQLQWESGLRSAGLATRVVHLAELVALGAGRPAAPRG